MTGKERNEIQAVLRELRARNTVLETVQTQLMIRIASMFDQPGEFVRIVMMNAEENLLRARRQATGEEKAIADDAVALMNDYSMRLIAGLTPPENPQ